MYEFVLSRDGSPKINRFGINYAPVAQLDRALAYEARGREFESLRAYQPLQNVLDMAA